MREIWVPEQVQLGIERLVKLLPTMYSDDHIAALEREARQQPDFLCNGIPLTNEGYQLSTRY